jgi:hypothetical protein
VSYCWQHGGCGIGLGNECPLSVASLIAVQLLISRAVGAKPERAHELEDRAMMLVHVVHASQCSGLACLARHVQC